MILSTFSLIMVEGTDLADAVTEQLQSVFCICGRHCLRYAPVVQGIHF